MIRWIERLRAPLTAASLGIAVAGCDDGIDPVFSRHALPPDLALLPADRVGIVVQPVGGVSEPFATEMSEAVAEALQEANVPASLHGGASESYFLSGDTAMTRNGDGTITLRVTWDLAGPDGTLVGSHEQRERIPVPNEQTGPLLQQIASRAAPDIAAMMRGDAPPAPLPVAASGTVSIGTITGAPGSGGRDLAAALAASLPLHGLAVTTDGESETVVQCQIAVTPAGDGLERIVLTWRVLNADGSELGQLSQDNQIAAGSLDGAWGEIAYLIADGVASGVAEILDRTNG